MPNSSWFSRLGSMNRSKSRTIPRARVNYLSCTAALVKTTTTFTAAAKDGNKKYWRVAVTMYQQKKRNKCYKVHGYGAISSLSGTRFMTVLISAIFGGGNDLVVTSLIAILMVCSFESGLSQALFLIKYIKSVRSIANACVNTTSKT